jgi:hypothetical protein
MPSPRRLIPLVVVAVAATALVLSGCTVNPPAPAVTVTVTPAAADPTPSASETQAPAANPAKPTPPHTTDDPCLRDSVKITYTATDNSAGHAHGILTFTSIASTPCNLVSYPTVWFDNPEAQQPMGAHSTKEPHTGLVPDFDLQPGASATATVTITDAGLVDGCNAVTAIAFLVIPPLPGDPPSDWSKYVEHVEIPATQACTNSNIALITVGYMNPA